jgi:hypothetical protein
VILSADVAGYSALTGRDEATTVQTLSEYCAVVATWVERHSGKIDDANVMRHKEARVAMICLGGQLDG